MEKQAAIRYLLLDRVEPLRVSSRYGRTQLARAGNTWKSALKLCEGDESQVTIELLDEVAKAVESGQNVVDYFLEFEV